MESLLPRAKNVKLFTRIALLVAIDSLGRSVAYIWSSHSCHKSQCPQNVIFPINSGRHECFCMSVIILSLISAVQMLTGLMPELV